MRRVLLVLFATLPVYAYADVVWPALYLEQGLTSWASICAGLVVEFFFIRKIFSLTIKKALIVDVTANAASVALGIILIPLVGLIWEIFPGLIINHWLDWGTFNPITWTATFLLACLINALIESSVITTLFKLPVGPKALFWLFTANIISVGIAVGHLWLYPARF